MKFSWFVRIMAWLAIVVISGVVAFVMVLVALLLPIDDGFDIGHLATAGILRNVA